MDKDKIFAGIREAVATRKPEERASLPDLPLDRLVSPARQSAGQDWSAFQKHFEAVNGDFLANEEELLALLQRESVTTCYCPKELLPIVEPVLGDKFALESSYDRSRVDEYQAGFTTASWAIAETGTLVLEDRQTPNRLGALAPWMHIAVIKKENLLPSVVVGIGKLSDDPNIVWVTGPSKTADVEGILIEGVHGPGIQACWVV